MTKENAPINILDPWSDDLLLRKGSANFLEKTINAQSKNPHQTSALCLAIDGDWGTGKSFFIERWRNDLASQGRCVVHFDAWTNDLSDDPLVGFISEISAALKPWLERLPQVSLEGKVVSRTSLFVKNAGNAVKPLLKAVVKHALVKTISEEGSNILRNAITGKNESETDLSLEIPSDAIEKYFEASMEGHKKQQESISHLITDLEKISLEIESIGSARPIYVFIDELDRCRPNYALRLLEGIKHVLNARGICFVLATNLTQLSHSVKAVYGEGFDGRGYLKRFIDYEYKLSPPNNFVYANHLVKGSTLSTRSMIYTGVSNSVAKEQNSVGDMLARVSNMFGLDLRTMRQVLGQAEAAAASIPETHLIHILYLFSLAAISKTRSDVLDILCESKPQTIPNLETMLKDRGAEFIENVRDGLKRIQRIYFLADLLEFYQTAIHLGVRGIIKAQENEKSTIKLDISNQILSNNLENDRPNIHLYPYLIRQATEINFN